MTRTEINKFVNDLVNLDRVRSLLKTIYYRRQFKAMMEEKQRQQRFEQGTMTNLMMLKICWWLGSFKIYLLSSSRTCLRHLSFRQEISLPPTATPCSATHHRPHHPLLTTHPTSPSASIHPPAAVVGSSAIGVSATLACFLLTSGISIRECSTLYSIDSHIDRRYCRMETSFSGRESHEEEDPQRILSSMQNSMWGGTCDLDQQ